MAVTEGFIVNPVFPAAQPLWSPGSVPYRLQAYQPDVVGHTLQRFQRQMRAWCAPRGVVPSQVAISITASVVTAPAAGVTQNS